MGKGLALLVALCAVATAQPAPTEEARDLYTRGDRHFKLGEYDAAIADFKAAYRLAPVPLLLFNLAQAHRLAGDCKQALWFYDKFAHSDAATDAIAAAEEHRVAMRACVAERTAAARQRATPRRSRLAWIGLGLGSAGVVAAALGGGFAYRAADQADRRDAACGDADGCTAAQARAFDDAGRSASRAAIGLFAAGGVAVASGVALYVVGSRRARVTVAPAERGRGATVAVGWAL